MTRPDASQSQISAPLSLLPTFLLLRVRRDVASLAAFIICAALGAGIAIMAVARPGVSPAEKGIHDYLVEWNQSWANYAGQRRAYLVVLAVVFLTTLLSGTLRRFALSRRFHDLKPWMDGFVFLLCGAFFGAAFFWQLRDFPALLAGIVSIPIIYLFAAGIVRAPPPSAMAVAALIAVGITVVPGLVPLPDLSRSSPEALVGMQTHYSVILGPGDRLAAGARLFDEVNPRYGIVWPCILAAVQVLAGQLSLGASIYFIRALQVVFVVFAAVLYWRHARGGAFPAGAALLFIAPWLQPGGILDFFPNVTAYRLIGLPLALVAMLAVERLPSSRSAPALGAVTGLLLLLNLEVGLCAAAGLVAYLILRQAPQAALSSLLQALAAYAAGLVVMLLLFLLLSSAAAGAWPGVSAYVLSVGRLAVLLRAGYMGMKLEFAPLPLFLFAHYAYVLVKTAIMPTQSGSFPSSFRAAVAVMGLLWFSYYVNRPTDWSLIGQLFLYGFFLIDLLRAMCLYVRRTELHTEPIAVMMLGLSLVLIPPAVGAYSSALPSAVQSVKRLFRGPDEAGAMVVSGVYLSRGAGEDLVRKARFIRERSRDGKPLYLTVNSFLVPKLSGVYPFRDMDDPFANLPLLSDTESFVARLEREGPRHIYIDDPESLMVGDRTHAAAMALLRKKLARSYRLSGAEDGWQIWERR